MSEGNAKINSTRKETMFENVINEEAIEALTPDQIDTLLAMFEEAGY
jgi:hypothetical protein